MPLLVMGFFPQEILMKHWLKVAICSLVLGGMLNGCFGSFGATRLLWSWNDSFGNKFVKTLIMWVFVIIPAYEIFIFADFWIINLIEFFMGSNPISSNYTVVPTEDGSMLATGANGDQYKFTAVDENRMIVEHDGVVLGEIAVDSNHQMVMTNYATADVQTLDLSNAPAM